MDYDELILREIDPPQIPDPADAGMENYTARCSICASGRADEIELICLNGLSSIENSKKVKSLLGVDISIAAIENHMLNHISPEKSGRLTELARYVRDFYGKHEEGEEPPKGDSILELLLYESLGQVLRGDIIPKNINEVLRVVQLAGISKKDEHNRVMDLKKLELESGSAQDVADYFRQLSYIMTALREKANTPELEAWLEEVVTKAFSLGMGKEFVALTDVDIYKREPVADVDMSLAVRDMLELGRKRTRKELEAVAEDFIDVDDNDIPPPDE